MAQENRDAIHKVQQYRKLVLVYEALDEEIDQLIMANGGATEKMSNRIFDALPRSGAAAR